MPYLNVEIKARCTRPDFVRNYLQDARAFFRGIDEQTDTYFKVQNGRLKLRQGNIENNLIYYERENLAGPKKSGFELVSVTDAEKLKEVLGRSLGVLTIVIKRREIYFLNNVKFHIDLVPGLGNFIEIEAGNLEADIPKARLQEQCEFYMKELGITPADLVASSYSDLVGTE